MNAIRTLLMNLCHLLACAGEMFRYALMFLWAIFCPKAVLAARLLAAESQLAVCRHGIASKRRTRPRFTPGFRLLWVVLSKSLDRWEDLAYLMQPATVKKWHTVAFRRFWRWKSCRKGGRPPITSQVYPRGGVNCRTTVCTRLIRLADSPARRKEAPHRVIGRHLNGATCRVLCRSRCHASIRMVSRVDTLPPSRCYSRGRRR